MQATRATWTTAMWMSEPGQTSSARPIASPSGAALRMPSQSKPSLSGVCPDRRMPAQSRQTERSATATWWSTKPSWEYQKCAGSRLRKMALRTPTPREKKRRPRKYTSTTVTAPSTAGTHIAHRSMASGSPGPTRTRSTRATSQSKVGGQMGCAPWGKLMKGSKLKKSGKWSIAYWMRRRW